MSYRPATARPHPQAPLRTQRGQALSEYLVASAVVLSLLALAHQGEGSALDQLLDAFRLGFARFSHFISLPL